jgi:hypothetical protein
VSGRSLRILALVLVLLGAGGIYALSQRGSLREHLLSTYPVLTQDGRSYTLRSDKPAPETAADIRAAWRPAQEVVDPGGTFLRYSDDIVAVTPDSAGGSTVHLDDEDRGYNRWFVFVGGFWGTGGSGGPIGGARGGGPGAGK